MAAFELIGHSRGTGFEGLPSQNCPLLDALADPLRALAHLLCTNLELIGCIRAIVLPGITIGLSIRRATPRRQNDQSNRNGPDQTCCCASRT